MFFSTSCKICKIIRIFLFSVFLLILLALIQKDKLHYLKFITPENAAYFILVAGILITILKFLNILKIKKINFYLLPTEYNLVYIQDNDQMYFRLKN